MNRNGEHLRDARRDWPEPAAVAAWFASDQAETYFAGLGDDVRPLELAFAEIIVNAFDEKSLQWWHRFTWSEMFTNGEIQTGVIRTIPDWFVEHKSTLPTDFQTISVLFASVFFPDPTIPKTIILPTRGHLVDLAILLRSHGIESGQHLFGELTGDECVVTAIGKRSAFGYWLRRGGKLEMGPCQEIELNLRHTNFSTKPLRTTGVSRG